MRAIGRITKFQESELTVGKMEESTQVSLIVKFKIRKLAG
jgi:hypothetical protein